jgi:hypothetical protein
MTADVGTPLPCLREPTVQSRRYRSGPSEASEAREAVREVPATVKRKAQGNPLAAGVIAFGLGMLVSSLIPSSEKERQAVSQLHENLKPVKGEGH